MKIVGLITEYNPFHNGHKYHIEKALEVTGADAIITIMSGNFVQRGTPALLSKHLRTEMALHGGSSLVLELPVCCATGSAEYFALGSISILNSLHCVDAVCFGSECGDIDILTNIAQILEEEPAEYKKALQFYLTIGKSFPLARQMALEAYTGDANFSNVLSSPNNILAIEYVKALRHLNSPIKAYTIKRQGAGYHETSFHQICSSASAIRSSILKNDNLNAELTSHIPAFVFNTLIQNYNVSFPVVENDFSLLLKYKLLSETKDSLQRYADVSTELANRIVKHRNDFLSWTQFCELLKTKELTYTRISRCLLHILLDITREQMIHYKENGFAAYARVLGFSQKNRQVLSMIKQNSEIPLLTKPGKDYGLSEDGLQMLTQDIFSSDLYESIITEKFHTPFISEYQKQIRIL